jgi:hypothetical protein
MEIREEKRDLFTVGDDYYLVQCISADFAMAAGIAVQFNKNYNIKSILKSQYGNFYDRWPRECCILVNNKVFNLVTKKEHYQKPTYDQIRQCLREMKIILTSVEYTDMIDKYKVAMPKIGCGLDQLDWDKVKQIIEDTFKDTNLEILICYI